MKKKTKNILIGVSVFIVLFFTVGGHFINKYYHKDVKSHPQMYCYETFYGPANSVLLIDKLSYKNQYLNHYYDVEKGLNPVIDFPLKTMPQNTPVYVMGYSEDGLLADVVSYYDRGANLGGSFTRAWVYAKTLHKDPPPKKKNK
jgi:hypothetical protein